MLKVKRNRKYGRKVRLCPFDKKSCSRPPSPIDGDFECGGIFGGDSDGNKVIFQESCLRLKGVNFFM